MSRDGWTPGSWSVRFERLLHALMGEAQQLGGAAPTQPKVGEPTNCLDRLQLTFRARHLNVATGPRHVRH